MDFETLKKDTRKYWIIGSIVAILLASVVFFVGTRAKYRLTQKVNIANGIINYKTSDLNVVAIKVSSDKINYTATDKVPTSGYALSSKSSCSVNGVVDSNITMKYANGGVTFYNLKKSAKCTLYFDIYQILANKTITIRTDFSTVLTENTTGKIYTAEDNDGTSYYFAGSVDNNWVKFGGFYWRIVRINGDGTIRLIYNGTTTDQTGSSTQIGTNKFNASSNDNAYVGYMYGFSSSSTYERAHVNLDNSNIKQSLDSWYNTNLNKTGIKEHIDTDAGFCGDRSLASGSGANAVRTYYSAYYRNYTNKSPSLKCTNSNDLYTVSASNKGNKALTYPVGLISADEVAYAGGTTSNNLSYYLYTNSDYWTMSSYSFDGSHANVFSVNSGGYLDSYYVHIAYGVRPVINLKADTLFTKGDGSKTSPFEISD